MSINRESINRKLLEKSEQPTAVSSHKCRLVKQFALLRRSKSWPTRRLSPSKLQRKTFGLIGGSSTVGALGVGRRHPQDSIILSRANLFSNAPSTIEGDSTHPEGLKTSVPPKHWTTKESSASEYAVARSCFSTSKCAITSVFVWSSFSTKAETAKSSYFWLELEAMQSAHKHWDVNFAKGGKRCYIKCIKVTFFWSIQICLRRKYLVIWSSDSAAKQEST